MVIIAQGAEALLCRNKNMLVKERIQKTYRLREIDKKLRTARTNSETRLLVDAKRAGINVPRVFNSSRFSIQMEFIEGKLVRDMLSQKNLDVICPIIGKQIAMLHNVNIIHGDLTTSNMILSDTGICFIDFGLGFRSMRSEDKAVDVYLLRQSLESTHPQILEHAWNKILKAYQENYKESDKIIKRLKKIENRRRYKKGG